MPRPVLGIFASEPRRCRDRSTRYPRGGVATPRPRYARITRELAATTLEATPEEDAAPEDGADEESVEAPVEAPDEDYAEDPAEEPIAGHLPSPGCVVRVPLGTSNASATSSTGTGTSSAKPSMPGSAPPKKGNVTARINAMLTTKN